MRAGPKAEITAGPLDLSELPRSGVRRVEQFARDYLKVTRGKGARGSFRLRAWRREIVGRLLPGSGLDPPHRPCGRGGMAFAAASRVDTGPQLFVFDEPAA
jgi:hypothetical protein